jgi:hypothetical protein
MRLISGGGPGPLDGYNHGLSFEYWRGARVNATIFPEAIFVENYAAILSSLTVGTSPPFQRAEFDGVERPPWPAPMDDLSITVSRSVS